MVELPKRPLTQAEQQYVLGVVYQNMTPDDREPDEVIAGEPYNGDQEKYCRDMAQWHGVDLAQVSVAA